MHTNTTSEIREGNGEISYFPTWFLTMTRSKLLLVLFAISVLVCAPLLMIFGAFYPLFKH